MKFEEIKLVDLVDTISDTRKIDKDKVILINTSDVLNGVVLNHSYTDNSNLRGQFKKRFKKDDILYSEIRPANKRFAYVDFDSEDYIASTKLMVLRRKSKEITDKFLYYCLTNDLFVERMHHLAEARSGTFPQITFDVLKNESILLPSIDNQNKITTIIDNINNKINLNNEINNNLQDLAKCIYYEKFKDKNNNGKLKDILALHRKSIKNKDESLKYFPVDVLPMNYLITKEGKPNEEAQSSLVEFKKYDILIGAMRVYFHRVCLAAENGITRTTTFVLRPKNEDYLYYSLITLDKDEFIKYANDGSKGSTMPYAVWDNNCNEYEIYIPTEEEAKEFNNLVKPLFESQIINEKNNRALEQLRDTLLPKLMSGKIDLDNIEI